MNAKKSVFVIYVEAITYLLLYNLHKCTFSNLHKLACTVHTKRCDRFPN